MDTGAFLTIVEDELTDLSTSMDAGAQGSITEIPSYSDLLVGFDSLCLQACPYPYTIQRMFIAEDPCGNEATCVQQITIQDTLAPVLFCPPDTVINCTSGTTIALLGDATASDSCDPAPLITTSDITSTGSCPQEYIITRSWIAIDACLNRDTCYQIITVQDTMRPVITCPPDTVVDCTSGTSTFLLGMATATDICDPTPSVSFSDVTTAGSCAQEYTITRRWTAEDACLNRDTCYQIITVQDTMRPVMVCPPDTVIDCTSGITPALLGEFKRCDCGWKLCAGIYDYQEVDRGRCVFKPGYLLSDHHGTGHDATCYGVSS
jgi:hypothetical protein